MGTVFQLHNQKLIFTLEEANALIPLIRRFTKESILRSERILLQMQRDGIDEFEEQRLRAHYEEAIREWSSKVHKLGAYSKGLWIVDFDNGFGFFCWRYPETEITHYHEYHAGYDLRRPIHEISDINLLYPQAETVEE